MSVPRRFDHDECRALFATGEWTKAALALKYGVTFNAIHRVVDDRARRMQALRSAEWQTARCSVCGERCSFNRYRQDVPRCRACAAEARVVTVRDDALRCATCKQWKRDTEFPYSRSMPHRRGRYDCCTACGTIARAAYRERHKVPCRSCGVLRLHPNDNGGANDTGLCRACWLESHRRTPAEATHA